jgi:hypothetical protein
MDNPTINPTNSLKRLEQIANALIKAFEIQAPPVPVETMLQKPRAGMWQDVNVSQLTGSFLSIRDKYSPRMSVARLLARHVMTSAWGQEQDIPALIGGDEEMLRAFARMIIMPDELMRGMSAASRNPVAMGMYFEVPEDEAEHRLREWEG